MQHRCGTIALYPRLFLLGDVVGEPVVSEVPELCHSLAVWPWACALSSAFSSVRKSNRSVHNVFLLGIVKGGD